ncbi:MAG: tRNA (adenosine(37)-N6)-threonylcarbamoyltransferase complex dimerization subunit type 1 TsaB, partial [Lachnospiraceae bacterium]
MRLLAIDSSGLVASVAIVEQDEERGRAVVLAEYMTNFKKTHSQTLLPMIQEMTDLMDLDLASLDAVAVAKGPGSFTGLRIG